LDIKLGITWRLRIKCGFPTKKFVTFVKSKWGGDNCSTDVVEGDKFCEK
jgi:hypothetical protein